MAASRPAGGLFGGRRARREAERARVMRRLGDAALGRVEAAAGQAVDDLRTALAGTTSPPSTWLVGLARGLVRVGAPAIEQDAAFGEAVRRRPRDRALVRTWASVVRDRDDGADPITALQLGQVEPIPAVLVHLLDGADAEQRRAALAGHLDRFGADPARSDVSRVWSDLGAMRPLEPESAARVADQTIIDLQLFFLSRPWRIVPLADAADAGLGLSADAMRWWAEEFLAPDHPPDWPERDFTTERMRELALQDDPTLAYQTRAVRERRLAVRDPHTGVEVAPYDTVVPYGRTVYSFGDQELTMLVTAGLGSRAAMLLLPRQGVLVDLGADSWGHARPGHIARMLAEMTRRAAIAAEAYAEAIATRPDPSAERRVVLLTSSVANPAHHLWNCFPGVEKIIDWGIADRVDEVRTAGSEFYGSLVDLFPELGAAELAVDTRVGVRDPYPFSPGHLIVTPGGYLIRRSLVDRLVARMAHVPATGHAEPPTPTPYPVIWIGLRVGSRSWVDQEHEVPAVIDALHAEHPEALVVLDGFSYPVGVDEVSTGWATSIDQLRVLGEQIRSRVRRPGQVIDMVGNTLREAVLWAAATDVYLTPSGSSQHKVGWLTSAPGVVYGPPSLATVRDDLRPGGREAEGRPAPLLVVGEPVSLGDRRSAHDTRSHLHNLRLDREELVRVVLGLLARTRRQS